MFLLGTLDRYFTNMVQKKKKKNSDEQNIMQNSPL